MYATAFAHPFVIVCSCVHLPFEFFRKTVPSSWVGDLAEKFCHHVASTALGKGETITLALLSWCPSTCACVAT